MTNKKSELTQTEWDRLTGSCQMYSRTETDNQYTYISALAPKVSDVAQWLRQHPSLYLTLCADTLIVDEDAVWPVETGVQMVVRCIAVQVDNAAVSISSGNNNAGLDICVREVQGNFALGWQGSNTQKIESDGTSICVFSWKKSGSLEKECGDEQQFADDLKTWTARNALRASFCAGAQLIYDTDTASVSVSMLQWVADACTAILKYGTTSTNPQDVGPEINDLLNQSNALLIYARSEAVGITVVPLLSETYYADRVNKLLNVTEAYQEKIDAIDQQKDIDKVLEQFASSLVTVTKNSQQPLQDELTAYKDGYNRLYDDYLKLLGLFNVQQDAVEGAKQQLDDAIKKADIEQKIGAVFSLVTSAIDACKAAAEFAAKDYASAVGDAFESFQKSIDALDKFSDSSLQDLKDQADALKLDFTSVSAVGINAYRVWEAVNYSNGCVSFEQASDFAQSLSDTSLSGDPGLSWKIFSQSVNATLDAVIGTGGSVAEAASVYKSALETEALYGEAIVDKIVALVRLAYQLADTAGRLLAVQNNEAVWNNLETNIKDDEQRIAAQESFIRERYMDIKRSLLVALENYRAAYAYFFLEECPTRISLDMDYAALSAALSGVSNKVGDLLDPTSPPLQEFGNTSWSIHIGGGVVFDDDGNVTWTISIDDQEFVDKLTPSHSKAVYLEQVEFFLYPEPPSGTDVQMKVRTSNTYFLEPPGGGGAMKFVAQQPFDLDAQYTVLEDGGSKYEIPWAPAKIVQAYYMKPSPFTQWTLTLVPPHPQVNIEGIEKIELNLKGVYWHN